MKKTNCFSFATMLRWRSALAISLVLLPCSLLAADAFIAGLQPYQRPQNAPTIKSYEQTPAWRQRALRGIANPPTGTDFLAAQGAWYTPFTQPGMPGKYDIRQLHMPGSSPEKTPAGSP